MRTTRLLCITVIIGLLAISSTSRKKLNAKSAKKVLDSFCTYIPSGDVVVDSDTLSVQAFYMSETEITNFQYAEFLYSLKSNGEMEKYAIAAVDTARWNSAFEHAYLNPLADYYHSHPAYRDFPVVNISKKGADLFCEWLTGTYDSLSNGELKLTFRVPTRAEWIRAANGDFTNSVYSWGGPRLQNAKGSSLANYLHLSAEHIARDEETGELKVVTSITAFHGGDFLTAPAKSYFQNDYGLYNMNGNVAEMVSDGDFAAGGDWHSPGYDIRNQSIKKFEGTHPTVGFRVVATFLENPEK